MLDASSLLKREREMIILFVSRRMKWVSHDTKNKKKIYIFMLLIYKNT